MLFNFFKHKNEQKPTDEDGASASVTYYMKSDGSGPYISIQLEDYDDNSILNLCELLDTLADESCYFETVEMIKSSLLKDGQEDLLMKIFSHLSLKVTEKIITGAKESLKDEPCIKPSDMV